MNNTIVEAAVELARVWLYEAGYVEPTDPGEDPGTHHLILTSQLRAIRRGEDAVLAPMPPTADDEGDDVLAMAYELETTLAVGLARRAEQAAMAADEYLEFGCGWETRLGDDAARWLADNLSNRRQDLRRAARRKARSSE
jgi:hypothetical protein